MKAISVLTTAALIAVSFVAQPVSAQADDVTPYACPEMGTHYIVSNNQSLHIPTGVDWKSGPGGTVSSSIEYSQTATMSVSLSTTFSLSAIVSEADATFGISASTYTYSHAVAAKKYGHLQFGNWGWKMKVRKYVVSSTCATTSDVTGTVNRMPSASTWGFRYWETSS